MILKSTKRAIIFFIGFFLVIFGLASFLLPLIPGIVFLLVGLLLLSTFSPTLRDWLEGHTRRYPKVHIAVLKLQRFITRMVGEA